MRVWGSWERERPYRLAILPVLSTGKSDVAFVGGQGSSGYGSVERLKSSWLREPAIAESGDNGADGAIFGRCEGDVGVVVVVDI